MEQSESILFRITGPLTCNKVHAVYPSIDQERLKHMTVDQILAKDPSAFPSITSMVHMINYNPPR